MSSFVKSFLQRVVSATTGGSPYDVKEGDLSRLTRLVAICRDESLCFTLYQDGSMCDMVFHNQQCGKRCFSLFRLQNRVEANDLFSKFSCHLRPLSLVTSMVYDSSKLQKICDCIRSNPDWATSHIAAHLGIPEAFRHNFLSGQLNALAGTSRLSPLHVAILAGQEACVRELLITPVDLSLPDSQGNTVYHYAAQSSNPGVIRLLACKNQIAINLLNGAGETPLHVAALSDKPEIIEALLMHGADPCVTRSTRFPIHCALKVNSTRCVQALCKHQPQLALSQDAKYMGTPMHWAQTREAVELLSCCGCPVNQANKNGESPLHVMIKCNRLDCVVALLSREAEPSQPDNNGNTPLHMALQTDDIDLVRTLVVFGADVNRPNRENVTPRHLAANHTGVNRDIHVYTLHMVGAARCTPVMARCSEGCRANGTFDGTPQGVPLQFGDVQHRLYDEMIGVAAVAALAGQGLPSKGSELMDTVDSPQSPPLGHRVLCLDGGGIRGLILIEVLQAIEKAAGRPIRDCFDWISGTSTGGILALALTHGKSVQYIQGMYFRLKEKVFSGSRPYDSEPLEDILKTEFGEHTTMASVSRPKVIVTGVLGDRHPAKLHLFTNYDKPVTASQSSSNTSCNSNNSKYKKTLSPHEQLVWRAARCSGAAPTYFRSWGRFLDGGLIANNPTLDTMTEIHEYNMGLKALNQNHMVEPLGIVVSLGTGRFPEVPVSHVDVFVPKGIIDAVQLGFGASALGALLVDQVTQSEGRVVDRARAWCSMIDVPYYRFSPLLSEELPLDCRDDKKLTRMLWETQCYIYQHKDKISLLAKILTSK